MTDAVVPVRRWPRRVVFGMAGLALLLPSGTAGAGWYFAAQVLTSARDFPLTIRAVNRDEVTITRTEDTERPIPQGLVWEGGHAQLGDILRLDRTSVVRKVVKITRGTLRTGARAYASSFVFDGNPSTAHGLDFTEVLVAGELGDYPAWLVPGAVAPRSPNAASDTWVIAVHGRGADCGEALRALPALAGSGASVLVISYRNDAGAPASRDGCYHLGADEWRDLEAAVRFARSRGAARIVLYGWSMGGAIILNAMRRSTNLTDVVGVVLDSPVIDWIATLRMQADQRRLPPPLTWSALRLVEQRANLRLASLDCRAYAIPVPTLVFLDADDRYVATWPTREFAAANPGTVRLVETSGGGHVRSWNVDPRRYDAELVGFLQSLPG
jgi:uncharacterized protein